MYKKNCKAIRIFCEPAERLEMILHNYVDKFDNMKNMRVTYNK